jgi:ubiquinone/menaquinone biosynthesis C-methylase UbiE
MDRRAHWDRAYESKGAAGVSWYQRRPETSLGLIERAGVGKGAGAIDVGGGASSLVDELLDRGYAPVAVLDVSPAALEAARGRLGERRAKDVRWIVADVTAFAPPQQFGVWHDRAVFHFLTSADDRRKYVEAMRRSIVPGGVAIIATFAPEGPQQCSGLPVCRYDVAGLAAELGDGFELIEQVRETHVTPWGKPQSFQYAMFRVK